MPRAPGGAELSYSGFKSFTIPKAVNPDYIRDNSGGLGNWRLTEEDIAVSIGRFPYLTQISLSK